MGNSAPQMRHRQVALEEKWITMAQADRLQVSGLCKVQYRFSTVHWSFPFLGVNCSPQYLISFVCVVLTLFSWITVYVVLFLHFIAWNMQLETEIQLLDHRRGSSNGTSRHRKFHVAVFDVIEAEKVQVFPSFSNVFSWKSEQKRATSVFLALLNIKSESKWQQGTRKFPFSEFITLLRTLQVRAFRTPDTTTWHNTQAARWNIKQALHSEMNRNSICHEYKII